MYVFIVYLDKTKHPAMNCKVSNALYICLQPENRIEMITLRLRYPGLLTGT